MRKAYFFIFYTWLFLMFHNCAPLAKKGSFQSAEVNVLGSENISNSNQPKQKSNNNPEEDSNDNPENQEDSNDNSEEDSNDVTSLIKNPGPEFPNSKTPEEGDAPPTGSL